MKTYYKNSIFHVERRVVIIVDQIGYKLTVPFCGKDSQKWHLGYSLEGNYLNCWRCGYLPVTTTLAEITGLSYSECKRLVRGLETDIPKTVRPKGRLTIPKGVGELSSAHKRYLRGRGFDYRELKRLWGIQGIGIASRLSWRIFIPIHYQGKVVSWTTRSISSSKKTTRYISASLEEESMFHHNLLYGEDFVQHTIIVTEGVFNVWRIGKGATATLGIGYSQAQMNRIVEYPVRVTCFDNEKEAQKRAKKLCDDTSVFPGETYNMTLDAKDPAEADGREIESIKRRFLR